MRTRVPLLATLLLIAPGIAEARTARSLGAPASLAMGTASAAAHAPGQAYMFLRMHGDSIVVRLELFAEHVDRALALGWDPEAELTQEQVQAQLARIRGYAESHFAFAVGEQPLVPTFRAYGTRTAEPGEYVLLEYLLRTARPERLSVTFTPFFDSDANHRNMLVIEHDWRSATFNNEGNVSLIFSPPRSDAGARPDERLDLAWLRGTRATRHLAHLDRLRPHPLPDRAQPALGAVPA